MIKVIANKDNGIRFTGMVEKAHFTSVTLDVVLGLLANHITATGDKEVVFVSKTGERPMPPEDVELLLTNPKALQAQMMPPPMVIDFRTDDKKSTLVVGYDTLANGFGMNVYCRRNKDKFECPGCSNWTVLTPCSTCGIELTVSMRNDRWVSVPTRELLSSKKEKFFTPRGWNNNRPWITHADLESKYQAFLKEKANV